MKKYNVEVVRISYCTKTFEVKAENEQDAKNQAFDLAMDTDYSGSEYDCEYEVNNPEEIPNDYIDRNGNPYDSEDENACWPAGGGLHKDCEFNADALYAYYVIAERNKIAEYLISKGFQQDAWFSHMEVWTKGNTRIVFEEYDRTGHLWGYMHTELVK